MSNAQELDAGAGATELEVWKTKAMAEFPDLKNPQSAISRKLAELRKAKAATPGYFSNPQWPYLLAKEAHGLSSVLPADADQPLGTQLAGAWDCVSASGWTGVYEFDADGSLRITGSKGGQETGRWEKKGEKILGFSNGKYNFTLHLPIKEGYITGVSARKNFLKVTKRPGTAVAKTEPSTRTRGIVLGRPNQLSQAQGGKSAMMADLEAILSKYGKPENDLAAHPDVTIYEGPSPGGGVGGTCRITYLMPRAKAETLLFRNRGIVTRKTAVAPGFPPGMVIHTYDIRFLIYNRFYLMVDQADQVVTLEFKSENTFAPGQPPAWTPIERDFSSFDYINTENRGTRTIRILTHAQRPPGASYIVVNMAASRINETTTWYVPDPLIRQILYHLGEDKRKGG